MIDASSVGMFEMYSKVQKNRLIFYYEVEKKDKKTDTRTRVDFFFAYFIVLVGHDDSRRCTALSLPAEDFPGRRRLTHLPVKLPASCL